MSLPGITYNPALAALDMPSVGIKCGQTEAVRPIYRRVDCARGVYLIPVNIPNPGDLIHFHNPRDLHSDGYGGATLSFHLEDGTVYAARGPWQVADSYLSRDTGIDLSHQHYARVIVCEEIKWQKWGYGPEKLLGVSYAELEMIVGPFHRELLVAPHFPHAKYCYCETNGGSHTKSIASILEEKCA